MRHSRPFIPQFYVTAPQPCPYLDGQMERKLFTSLSGENSRELSEILSQQGFRRSQNVLYRPSCPDCAACLSARINVAMFSPSKSQKRTLKRNATLMRSTTSSWASEPQYELFRRYVTTRHAQGGMADMDLFEFAAMIEEAPIPSRIVEYREHDTGDLIAVCLTDLMEDGLSMVYSFFDPDAPKRSLGTYMILDHIALAREAGLAYVYLGYWVPNSPKMSYKARFSGLEVYHSGKWQNIEDSAAYASHPHPLSTQPICEQLSQIALPTDQNHKERP